ncbi:hypothetical protein JDN40_16985 [Rhodomicrobium vannielii ATCC 17100]|uniref:hypothetical protein n=1 Tax=Rhodomicrobium vannielii TaxID=1069 RepID=UPI001917C4E9|nr:hypothetical protein [Rhodomicrobium vannielii]MBJ7535804.1 hypothetical protein [Rhodomicrobium vannielii ATCC 17100]
MAGIIRVGQNGDASLPAEGDNETSAATFHQKLDAAEKDKKNEEQCIAPTDGPVYFGGGALDLVAGVGASIGIYGFYIPSTGAHGLVASGSFLGGAGVSLAGGGGLVSSFGNFTGSGWRGDINIPATVASGEVLLGDSGNLAGGAGSLGVGTGAYVGRTKTTVLSSNIPVCPPDK